MSTFIKDKVEEGRWELRHIIEEEDMEHLDTQITQTITDLLTELEQNPVLEEKEIDGKALVGSIEVQRAKGNNTAVRAMKKVLQDYKDSNK